MNKYQSDRPIIPANIRREVEVEAGHECSIISCNEHTYLEMHHINQDREDNRKENLILLCDKHHKMAHAKVIDRKALRKYKEILVNRSNNGFIRASEGDRVHSFLKKIIYLLSYIDCDQELLIGSESGYWFEEQVYIKLRDFFNSMHTYNLDLRSYDPSVRDKQDRIVDLLRQILGMREQGDYRYKGGYAARFYPKHVPGTSEYDNEIDCQIELMKKKLTEIQKLVFELWEYVENR